MTQHPSRHNDADQLNSLLDAVVSGKRAPDTGSASESDAFAATHRLVRGDAAAYASATPSEETLDRIWRTVMQTPAAIPQVPEGTRPPVSARQKARIRAIPEQPRPSRFQTFVSIAAVAAMLIIAIGAAWMVRGGTGLDDREAGRYAVVPLEPGTPESAESVWYTPVMPEDCVAERMDPETYADIMRSDPTPEPRSYLPVTPVTGIAAEEVALAGRTREACLIYGEMQQWRTLETPSALYARTAGLPTPAPEDVAEREQLVQHLPVVPFNESAVYTQDRMPEHLAKMTEGRSEAQFMTYTYLPDYAYRFADGRVAIAMGVILWANPQDEHFKVRIEENPEARSTTYAVFSPVDGAWLYDETITICEGECDSLIPTPVASPVGFTPDVVIASDAPVRLREGPSPASDEVIVLPPQTPLETLGRSETSEQPQANTDPLHERWVNVRTEDGTTGWVRQIDLEPYGPISLPAATPDDTNTDTTTSLPAATYVHPHPALCTTEPLSVDEVMAILEGDANPGGATPATGMVPEMNAATYEELRDLLDEYLSCEFFGGPFRSWALSSPDLIRAQVTGGMPNWMPGGQIRQMLEEMQREVDAAPDWPGLEWTPMGNPAIPALPDEYNPSLAYIGEDGRAYATVVWVTRNGEPPSEEYGFPIGAGDGTSIMVFVWDAAQGRWLIDGTPLPGQ